MNNFETVFSLIQGKFALGKKAFYANLLEELATIPEANHGSKYSFIHDGIRHIAIAGDYGTMIFDETGLITMQTIYPGSLWNDGEYSKLAQRALLAGVPLIGFQENADHSVTNPEAAKTFADWMRLNILPAIEVIEKLNEVK